MATGLSGLKFGRWSVIGMADRVGYWECVCECGTRRDVKGENLSGGRTRSCGCLQREIMAQRRTHGASSGGKTTVEYNTWIHIRDRCQNPNCKAYPYYGGRGIKVCERWDASFEAFLSDMGERPSAKHSIERIEVDGDYEPGNCRWATKLEQARNKRSNCLVECNGEMVPMSVAAEFNRIPYKTVASRLSKGWSRERAVSEPVSQARLASQFRAERLIDVSKRTGIPVKTLSWRLHRGWPEELAFSKPTK